MTELEEIEYREKLLKTLRLGGKVEPSEREWLVTHKAFSDIYGWPFLVMDIIELEPNRTYTVTAELLFKNCCETMMPTVSVPQRKGKILFNDPEGQLQKTTALGLFFSEKNKELVFSFKAKNGLLCVTMEYLTKNHMGTEYWASSVGRSGLAMEVVESTDTKRCYTCRGIENRQTEHFDFELRWEKSEVKADRGKSKKQNSKETE